MWQILSGVIGRIAPSLGNAPDLDDLKKEAEQFTASVVQYDVDTAVVSDEKPSVAAVSENECFTNTGVVTKLEENYGIINEMYQFEMSMVPSPDVQLAIGTVVKYLAQNMPGDLSVRVIRIIEVVENNWESPTEGNTRKLLEELREKEPDCFSLHKRSIMGQVVSRRKSIVSLELEDGETMDVDMETVNCVFVPTVGDEMVLDCKVQLDESFVDMKGVIVDVENLTAARSKQLEGLVTSIHPDKGYGDVDRIYLFYFDALDGDYMQPQVGDRVAVDAIESKQQYRYSWRCLKVVLIGAMVPKTNPIARKDRNGRQLEGLCITDNLKVNFDRIDQQVPLNIRILNTSDDIERTIAKYFFIDKRNDSQIRLIKSKRHYSEDKNVIRPQESYDFEFMATARFYGASTETFMIKFENGDSVMRSIDLELIDKTGNVPSVGTGPNAYRNKAYTNAVWNKRMDITQGVKMNERSNFVAVHLGSWEVPVSLRNLVLSTTSRVELAEQISVMLPFLSDVLSYSNYEKTCHNLLFLEEIQIFHSMRRFDRDRAHFIREKEYLALHVPNIAEARPSLVMGDYVLATDPFSPPTANGLVSAHRGEIHKVFSDRILLRFHDNFHSKYNNEDYRLEFHFSRVGMRKCHFAVQKSIHQLGPEFLFPSKVVAQLPQLDVQLEDERLMLANGKELPYFNDALNAVQKEAVKNVLRGEARPMPYVIFGPPGTGKTSTLIETILQICTSITDSRVMVAAPSNSAANILTMRLAQSGVLQPGDFVRLAGFNAIESGKIPEELLPFTATCELARDGTCQERVKVLDSGVKLRCGAKMLGRHRITIGTCNTLGTMMQMEFSRGHFTHVIIDECGQCLEPEALIPMTFVNRTSGQVILAGDPMQLGPIVMSRSALDYGLATSFLVRMLNRFPYMKDIERHGNLGYDKRLVTKLVYCYRSLPSLVHVFSKLFYHLELIPTICPEKSVESLLLRKLNHILPNPDDRTPNHGIFFIGIRGDNQQDYDSPSWFNAAEAKSVMCFLIKLYLAGVHENEIGIITPYTKQVKVIRGMLTEQDVKVPKIGTVEEFQGQERMIILISTVRSSKSLVIQDRMHRLGFVKNGKRLNVAISRARSLLMIFGDPHLLSLDSNWKYVLNHCHTHKTYTGCDLPEAVLKRFPEKGDSSNEHND